MEDETFWVCAHCLEEMRCVADVAVCDVCGEIEGETLHLTEEEIEREQNR